MKVTGPGSPKSGDSNVLIPQGRCSPSAFDWLSRRFVAPRRPQSVSRGAKPKLANRQPNLDPSVFLKEGARLINMVSFDMRKATPLGWGVGRLHDLLIWGQVIRLSHRRGARSGTSSDRDIQTRLDHFLGIFAQAGHLCDTPTARRRLGNPPRRWSTPR